MGNWKTGIKTIYANIIQSILKIGENNLLATLLMP